MRNLFIYILKYHFIILFIGIEILCFSLIVRNNYYQNAKFVNSSNVVAGFVYSRYANITGYLDLKKTNEQLAKENAKLRSVSGNSFVFINKKTFSVKDSVLKQEYFYVSAKVINNSVAKPNNFMTINKGRKDGVHPDMAVICDKGIVGIVNEVSDNFASVISFLHKDVKISAKIKKRGAFGSLFWDGNNIEVAALKDISNHVKISIGDTIVTSGYSVMFPEGILIGTIVSFRSPPTENFYRIYIKLSTDFTKLKYVYVVNSLMRKEVKELEKTNNDRYNN
ncbi:MAG: rod shape-determining protein MreC [Bacteroidales bacterium]|nr:rod shape-determining protein MreC [Bacteroidales bacterium]